jgi:hypothetical protein
MHGPVVEAGPFEAIRLTGRVGDGRFVDQIQRQPAEREHAGVEAGIAPSTHVP